MEYPLNGIINASAVLAEAESLGDGIRIMRVDHLSITEPQDTVTFGRGTAKTPKMTGNTVVLGLS